MDERHIRRRLRLRDLETFLAVVQAGGMRKAAGGVNLSLPAVSRAVADLEGVFGVQLLQRTRRGVEPTAFGEALARRAGAVLDELASTGEELAFLADPGRGSVRIGAGESIQAGLLSASIEQLFARHPRMRVEVESSQAGPLVDHFLPNRLIDFAVARPLRLPLPPDIEGSPLFRERLLVGVGYGHPLARRRRLALKDLVEEHWILSVNELMDDAPLMQALSAARLPRPDRIMTSGSLQSRLQLLPSNRFITLFPHTLFPFGDFRQRVRLLPIELPRWQVPTMVLQLRSRRPGPAALAAIEVVKEVSRPLAAD
jgi:DNA-binding transcriptional LysR family regulator